MRPIPEPAEEHQRGNRLLVTPFCFVAWRDRTAAGSGPGAMLPPVWKMPPTPLLVMLAGSMLSAAKPSHRLAHIRAGAEVVQQPLRRHAPMGRAPAGQISIPAST